MPTDATTILVGLGSAGISAGAGVALGWRTAGAKQEAIAVKTLRGVIHELVADLERKEREMERQGKELHSMRERAETLAREVETLIENPPKHLA